MFLLEKMLDEVVRTTQHQQLNKNSVSRLSPAALLLRLCLLAVCWLNMSKGINPISQGCWGEIGRSVVWLLPPSMHAVKGGGWHRHRLWPRYTAFVHGRIQVVSDRHVWVCPAATFLFPSLLIIPKRKHYEANIDQLWECCWWSTSGAEQDYFTNCTPDMQDGSQCSDWLLHALPGAQRNLRSLHGGWRPASSCRLVHFTQLWSAWQLLFWWVFGGIEWSAVRRNTANRWI